MSELDVAIIGAGVIGLSIAFHLVEKGARIVVIDRNPEGDKASFGNAGAIAVTEVVPAAAPRAIWRAPGWMLDPLGPLSIRPKYTLSLIPWLFAFAKASTPERMESASRALASINGRAYDDLLPMLAELGLGNELHRTGALTLYESERGYRADAAEWKAKQLCGVVTKDLTASEARELEPALGRRVYRAVMTPQWSYVSDPKALVDRLREWAVAQGVRIIRGEVEQVGKDVGSTSVVKLVGKRHVQSRCVVIAAGAWSGELAKTVGDRVLLESERGYNTTLTDPGVTVRHQLIFAERKFVATPLSCGLRIGGAAEFGGLRAAPNFRRSRVLTELAAAFLPGLRTEQGVMWAGHRPTTPDSLPVIGASPRNPNVYYAFGHGHLGLTQAATTGRVVSELLTGLPPSVNLRPFSVSRFAVLRDAQIPISD